MECAKDIVEPALRSIANSLRSQSLFWDSDAAASRLRQVGRGVIKDIADYLGNSDPFMRYAAVVCLGQLPQDPSVTLPALISCTDDSHFDVGYTAFAFLHGPKSVKVDGTSVTAVPRVIDLIKNKTGMHAYEQATYRIYNRTIRINIRKDKRSYSEAWHIMGRIGKEAIPFVIGLLDEKDEAIRVDAALFIEVAGLKTQETAAPIAALLGDSNRYIRALAARILGKLSVHTNTAIPPLIKALNDTAKFYAEGGEFIVPTRDEILSSLKEIGEDEGNLSVRDVARKSLERISGERVDTSDISTEQEFWRKWLATRGGDQQTS